MPGKQLDGQGGQVSRRDIERLAPRVIPPDPFTIVALPKPTRPALLHDLNPPREVALELIAIYRDVYRTKTGALSMAYKGGRIPQKAIDRMHAAAATLWVAEISPAAWAESSFDQWAASPVGDTGGPPTILWVWSPTRLEPKSISRAWFNKDKDAYMRARQVLLPEMRSLVEVWNRMWAELEACNPKLWDDVVRVVDDHFPKDAFDVRIRKVRAELALQRNRA